MPRRKPIYLPTMSEIAAACERIQRTWTEDERDRRVNGPANAQHHAPMVVTPAIWHPPSFCISRLGIAHVIAS
jgi:hypothetical protein